MIRAMNDVAAAAARPYDNSHRAAQAGQTRTAILDALVRVMARGVAELSVPAVAQEAGVSLRTVYRHFPTKRDLLHALEWHLDARMEYSAKPYPTDFEGLAGNIRQYYRALDRQSDADRAIRASQLTGQAREDGLGIKREIVAGGLGPATASLSEPERTRLFNVVMTLFSRFTLQRMKDDLGLSADDAAEHVIWAIRTLVRATVQDAAPGPDLAS
jgi:AcrR family transcriptional regulator